MVRVRFTHPFQDTPLYFYHRKSHKKQFLIKLDSKVKINKYYGTCCVYIHDFLATLQHLILKNMPRTRNTGITRLVTETEEGALVIIWCSFGEPQKLALDHDIQTQIIPHSQR